MADGVALASVVMSPVVAAGFLPLLPRLVGFDLFSLLVVIVVDEFEFCAEATISGPTTKAIPKTKR